jgi:hypothetical protein
LGKMNRMNRMNKMNSLFSFCIGALFKQLNELTFYQPVFFLYRRSILISQCTNILFGKISIQPYCQWVQGNFILTAVSAFLLSYRYFSC